jgi:hypothetical protein
MDQLIQLQVNGSRVAVLRVLNDKHLKNVMIVVPVLMTSRQVSE